MQAQCQARLMQARSLLQLALAVERLRRVIQRPHCGLAQPCFKRSVKRAGSRVLHDAPVRQADGANAVVAFRLAEARASVKRARAALERATAAS
jgi:hypothetical protein